MLEGWPFSGASPHLSTLGSELRSDSEEMASQSQSYRRQSSLKAGSHDKRISAESDLMLVPG